jgi:hypothetical protein
MSIFEAAVEVASFLERERIPYAILGGLALQHWGEPRTTQDVDIVLVSEKEEDFKGGYPIWPRMAMLFLARRNRCLDCHN